MDKFVIRGGNPLLGTIQVSGAKNAALPAMAAALLTDEPVVLENIPQVRDIETTRKLLAAMGAEGELGYGRAQHRTTISCKNLASPEASYELVKTMRASTLVLGPLVARCGRARVSLPGGCAIGPRPVDLHIKGLQRLGAEVELREGYIDARAPKGLRGAEIAFPAVSVGATENLLMAASLAEGETLLINAAREPEITDLAECLVAMGARIEGIGTDRLRIVGVPRLHGATHSIIPDRIETGTYIMAAAATNGEVTLTGTRLDLVAAVARILEGAGVEVAATDDGLTVRRYTERLEGVDVMTEPYPGFPT